MSQRIIVPPIDPPEKTIQIFKKGELVEFFVTCGKDERHKISCRLGGRIRLHDHDNIKAEAVARTLQNVDLLPACIQFLMAYRQMIFVHRAFEGKDLANVKKLYIYREWMQLRRQYKRGGEESKTIWTPPNNETEMSRRGAIVLPTNKEIKHILKKR